MTRDLQADCQEPGSSASEVTTLRRYTNLFIIIIIIMRSGTLRLAIENGLRLLFHSSVRLQEKLVRAMFSHSLLYPARPSLLDARLVFPPPPPPAGAPRAVGFPTGAPAASLPLFSRLMPDRDAGVRLPLVIDDQPPLPPTDRLANVTPPRSQ